MWSCSSRAFVRCNLWMTGGGMSTECFVITRAWTGQRAPLPIRRLCTGSRRHLAVARGRDGPPKRGNGTSPSSSSSPPSGKSGRLRSPYFLVGFKRSRYVAHMNELEVRSRGVVKKDAATELDKALMETGIRHEARVLLKLRDLGLDVVSVSDRGSDGKVQTDHLIRENREVIHQAVLRDDFFNGIADFLLLAPDGCDWKRIFAGDADELAKFKAAKRDERTKYMVMEVKTSGVARADYVLQTLCYADMLEKGSRRCAETVLFWLGSNRAPLDARRSKYTHFFHSLREEYVRFVRSFDPDRPVPAPDRAVEKLSPWADAARAQLVATDALELVAGIRQNQITALRRLGIHTLTELAEAPSQALRSHVLRRLQRQAQLQRETLRRRERDASAPAAYEALEHPAGKSVGLQALPPADAGDLFFDMEGFPLYALEHGRGLEYLSGYVDADHVFHALWAHDHAQEAQAIEAFVRSVHRRWRSHPSMHVYHYGAYETSALRKVASHIGGDTDVLLAELQDAAVFVDLLAVVRQGLRIGEESYSLKKVERLFGTSRAEDELADAQSSVGMYFRFVSSGDPAERAALLRTIADYNAQDCLSTVDLATWLRKVQHTHRLTFQAEPPVEMEDEAELSLEDAALLRVPGACGRGAVARIADARVVLEGEAISRELLRHSAPILAHLVSFHLREGRPARQRFRDRLVRADFQDLYSDDDCISSVRIRKQGAIEKARSVAWSVVAEYDPSEPLRLGRGARVALLEPTREPGKPYISYGVVSSIRSGEVVFELAKRTEPLPASLSVIAVGDLGYCPSVMRQSILTTAKKSLRVEPDGADRTRLLDNFLAGRAPRMLSASGERCRIDACTELGAAASDREQRMLELIGRLEDGSVLVVQGPPGSGKTRLCANVIAALARGGRRVAVSSNSHPSIDNALLKVAALGVDRVVKVPSIEGEGALGVGRASSVVAAVRKHAATVVGATVYQLSRPEAEGLFDVLFVDEAGQVPLANFVAMAPAAQKAVLVGDQRQLEMPLQGFHDGATGQSCLQFALGEDCVTVPRNLGLFLDTSYRMAPSLCRLVSEGVYDGSLRPHESTADNAVEVPADASAELLVDRGHGVLFVGHAGDRSAADTSSAEVDIARRVLNELQGRPYRTAKGEGRLTRAEILVVAPFNAQVAALRRSLGSEVRVGTVDKFQGQEAPVVIISMCGIDADNSESSSRRSASFVLRKNRLNVAISRAQCLAIVIGSTELTRAPVENIDDMELVSLFCRIVEEGSGLDGHFKTVDVRDGGKVTVNDLAGHLSSVSLRDTEELEQQTT